MTFDPDERFFLPAETDDPDEVLKKLLEPDEDAVSDEPEDDEAES